MCPLGACVGLQTVPTAGTPKDSLLVAQKGKNVYRPHMDQPTWGPHGISVYGLQRAKQLWSLYGNIHSGPTWEKCEFAQLT